MTLPLRSYEQEMQDLLALSKLNQHELERIPDQKEEIADRLQAARSYLAKLKEEVPSLNTQSYLRYLAKRES